MNNIVYKYPLEVTDKQQINLPKGAEILTIQTQAGAPQMWVHVNSENADQAHELRSFETYGTGHPMKYLQMDKERRYIGTYQIENGQFIFHVFELVARK